MLQTFQTQPEGEQTRNISSLSEASIFLTELASSVTAASYISYICTSGNFGASWPLIPFMPLVSEHLLDSGFNTDRGANEPTESWMFTEHQCYLKRKKKKLFFFGSSVLWQLIKAVFLPGQLWKCHQYANDLIFKHLEKPLINIDLLTGCL